MRGCWGWAWALIHPAARVSELRFLVGPGDSANPASVGVGAVPGRSAWVVCQPSPASLLRRPPHANKKETFSEMPKGRGRVHTGHTVRRASAAQCDRRADRRPAARGAGYAFAASVSSFTPTHACPDGNASVSFVRSETALEITASMSLTVCFLIRHGQLPARQNTAQRRGDAARTRRETRSRPRLSSRGPQVTDRMRHRPRPSRGGPSVRPRNPPGPRGHARLRPYLTRVAGFSTQTRLHPRSGPIRDPRPSTPRHRMWLPETRFPFERASGGETCAVWPSADAPSLGGPARAVGGHLAARRGRGARGTGVRREVRSP